MCISCADRSGICSRGLKGSFRLGRQGSSIGVNSLRMLYGTAFFVKGYAICGFDGLSYQVGGLTRRARY